MASVAESIGRSCSRRPVSDTIVDPTNLVSAEELLFAGKSMPRIYRSMKQADDGLPLVGSGSNELGVRIPPNPHADVEVDTNGDVILNGSGMSVADGWRCLLPHLVPKRLRSVWPGATGSNKLSCFRLGDGPFCAGSLNDRLSLLLKEHDPRSGNIVPTQIVPLQHFLEDLAATRSGWAIGET